MAGLLAVAFLMVWVRGVAAEVSQDAETLRGVKAIGVVMESGVGSAQLDGLGRLGVKPSQIRTDVELRLRRAGIKLLPSEGGAYRDYLGVNVVTYFGEGPVEGLVVWFTEIALYQEVTLRSGAQHKAPTWRKGAISMGGKNNAAGSIRAGIGGYVDEFIKDYLEVNPVGRAR